MSLVRTDNYLHADGLDRMALTAGQDGPVIVTGTLLEGEPGGWLIEADGHTAASAPDRARAIEMMNEMSLLVLGVSGASLYVPPEVVGLQ